MDKTKKAQLTQGPIGKTLITLSLPMYIGILSMIAFNLIDTFFVGRLGTNELAAMSFTFPVVMVIGSLAMGLGIGLSALVSKAIGAGDFERVRRLTSDGLVLSVLVVLIAIIGGLLTIEPLFRALGATPDIIELIKEYMTIWYPGVLFVVVPMVGNNIIRATGDTKTPSLIMLVVVIINGILDPLLIFGIGPFPRLELAGAAIATVIARAVTLIVALWIIAVRERMLTTEPPQLHQVLQSWKDVLAIGIPGAITNMIIPVSLGVVTKLVAVHGPAAVAAFGVASRIDIFVLSVTLALGAVLSPFVGQNWGAGHKDRVDTAITYSLRFVMGWGIVMFFLFLIIGQPVATLFNTDTDVVAATTLYLSIVPLSYAFQGVLNLSNSVLNVLQKPLYATGVTMVQMFILLIPLALIGSYLFGLIGIFGAIVVANVLAGSVAYGILGWVTNRVNWEPATVAASEA